MVDRTEECNENLTAETAESYRILQRMIDKEELELVGKGRYAYYRNIQ